MERIEHRLKEFTLKSICFEEIKQNNKRKVAKLRKDKLFKNLMAKRLLNIRFDIDGLPLKTTNEKKQKEVSNNIINNKPSDRVDNDIRKQFDTPLNVLQELKQLYYGANENQLTLLLEEIRKALQVKETYDYLHNTQIIDFIIKMIFDKPSRIILFLCLSIMIAYTFNSKYATEKFNNVNTLNKLIRLGFAIYGDKGIIYQVLIIIWNVYNDHGNNCIIQTDLITYLSQLIVNEDSSSEKYLNIYNESIIINLFVLLQDTNLETIKPQINQMLSFIIEIFKNCSGKKEEDNELLFVLKVIELLSVDDEISLFMLEEGVVNQLFSLFNYLFMTKEEQSLKNTLVLSSLNLKIILRILNNYFTLSDTIISSVIPEMLFQKIILELIKRERNSLLDLNNNILNELMLLIANVAACARPSLKSLFSEDNDLIKDLITFSSSNHHLLLYLLYIIENIFFIYNIQAINCFHQYQFMDIINRALIETNMTIDIKAQALKILILIIKNSTQSDIDYPFDLSYEIETRNIMNTIALIYDQSDDSILGEYSKTLLDLIRTNELN